MNNVTTIRAAECIDEIRFATHASEVGYKVQALAAHVLLRLEYRVVMINRDGHPDIVAVRGASEVRFEIETEVGGPRPRQLTDEDFASLLVSSEISGYFALAICSPMPRWIVVPAESLRDRGPSSNMLLGALSDVEFSNAWTQEFNSMLSEECRQIRQSSFETLCKRAMEGRGL